jgi:hypothetical protein
MNVDQEIINTLVRLQVQRRFAIVSQSRAERSTEMLIARMLGYEAPAERDVTEARKDKETARKAMFKRAATVRQTIEKVAKFNRKTGEFEFNIPKGLPAEIDENVVKAVVSAAAGRRAWDELRESVEKQMEVRAKQLPVWSWAKDVKGLGARGLAVIIGETRDINRYDSVAKLWKRCGLAVIDGKRQGRRTDPDEAIEHGYAPKRRAEIYAFLQDTMLRQQWRGADGLIRKALLQMPAVVAHCESKHIELKTLKGDPLMELAQQFGVEDIAGEPAGPYGEVYRRRREHTASRIEETADLPFSSPLKWTKTRCKNDATRIMAKAVIRDLWRVWHGQEPKGARIEWTRSNVKLAAD